MNIGIIDYGLGNIHSVVGAVKYLGHTPFVADNEKLDKADKLILPGVGAFGDGMKNLAERFLIERLNRLVLEEKKTNSGYLSRESTTLQKKF